MSKKDIIKKIDHNQEQLLDILSDHKKFVSALVAYLGLEHDIEKKVFENFWSGKDEVITNYVFSAKKKGKKGAKMSKPKVLKSKKSKK